MMSTTLRRSDQLFFRRSPDAAGRKVHGKPFSEVGHAGFGGGIGRNFCQRTERVHGGNIQNIPSLSDHILRENLRDKERRRDIEVKNKFQAAFVQIKEGLGAVRNVRRHNLVVTGSARIISACSVYQNADLAQLFVYCVRGTLNVRLGQAVGGDGDRIFADGSGDRFRRL